MSVFARSIARIVPATRIPTRAICTRSAQIPAFQRPISLGQRWASSTTPYSTATDPAETEALRCLEQGTKHLEEGDVEAAKTLYLRSVEIKRNASSLFNLGVTHYHLKEIDQAIEAWNESIALQPASPDAHTSAIPRPDLALKHLNTAATLSPEDPEIAFNLAAVLEATGRLEEALAQYQRSKRFGVERAAMHIRNVGAKILGKKLKAEEEQQKIASSSPESVDKTADS